MTPAEAKDPQVAVIGGRDREAFPEFYAEYDARVLRNASAPVGARSSPAPSPIAARPSLQHDIANLKAGLAKVKVTSGFLPVVAPASALPNAKIEYYRGRGELSLRACRTRCASNTRPSSMPGSISRSMTRSCPTCTRRWSRPTTMAQYRTWAELRVAALNRALEGLPRERTRYHICWGSWNGPHMFDVPLKDIVDIVLSRSRPAATASRRPIPRHEHEWQVWKSVKLPPGTFAHAGRRHPLDQHRRASRAGRRAPRALRRNRRGAKTWSPAPIAASRKARSPAASHWTIMWAKLQGAGRRRPDRVAAPVALISA